MAFLPEAALSLLEQARAADRLAHAYLITGASAETNERFLRDLAAMVLGAEPEKLAAHLDYHEVRPESRSRRILIEQMRSLEHALHQRAVLGKNKVAAIYEADRLVEAGANAFLKTLEEPSPGTLILLTSQLPEAILGTILSRCIQIPLRSPKPGRTPRERAARDIARGLLDASAPCGIPEIFLAVRKFQSLLAEVREEAAGQADAWVKQEKAHYKDRADLPPKWLEELEERLAAATEATVVRERARLIDALASVLAERLRELSTRGDPRLDRSETLRLLRQVEAVQELRHALDRNLNESLALESSFLEIFSHP